MAARHLLTRGYGFGTVPGLVLTRGLGDFTWTTTGRVIDLTSLTHLTRLTVLLAALLFGGASALTGR